MEVVVHLLLEVRNPSAVDLGAHQLQIGEPVEHAREDHLDDAVGDVEEAPIAGQARSVRLGHGAPQADVDAHRKPVFDERGPHAVVFVGDIEGPVRVTAHDGTADARSSRHPTQFGGGRIGATVGKQQEAAKTFGGMGHVLRQPVVVGPHHGHVELRIRIGDDALAQPGRGVENLGIDTVLVHLGQTGHRVIASVADIFEADPCS